MDENPFYENPSIPVTSQEIDSSIDALDKEVVSLSQEQIDLDDSTTLTPLNGDIIGTEQSYTSGDSIQKRRLNVTAELDEVFSNTFFADEASATKRKEYFEKNPQYAYMADSETLMHKGAQEFFAGKLYVDEVANGDTYDACMNLINSQKDAKKAHEWLTKFNECKDENEAIELAGSFIKDIKLGQEEAIKKFNKEWNDVYSNEVISFLRGEQTSTKFNKMLELQPDVVEKLNNVKPKVQAVMDILNLRSHPSDSEASLLYGEDAWKEKVEERAKRILEQHTFQKEKGRGVTHVKNMDEARQQAAYELRESLPTSKVLDDEVLKNIASIVFDGSKYEKDTAVALQLLLQDQAEKEQPIRPNPFSSFYSGVTSAFVSAIDYSKTLEERAKRPESIQAQLSEMGHQFALGTSYEAPKYDPKEIEGINKIADILKNAERSANTASSKTNVIAQLVGDVSYLSGEMLPLTTATMLTGGAGGGWIAATGVGFGTMYPSIAERDIENAYSHGYKNPFAVGSLQAVGETGAEVLFNAALGNPIGRKVTAYVGSKAMRLPVAGRVLANVKGVGVASWASGVALETAGEISEDAIADLTNEAVFSMLDKMGVDIGHPDFDFVQSVKDNLEPRQLLMIGTYSAMLGLGGARGDFAKAREFSKDRDNLKSVLMSDANARSLAYEAERLDEEIGEIMSSDLTNEEKASKTAELTTKFNKKMQRVFTEDVINLHKTNPEELYKRAKAEDKHVVDQCEMEVFAASGARNLLLERAGITYTRNDDGSYNVTMQTEDEEGKPTEETLKYTDRQLNYLVGVKAGEDGHAFMRETQNLLQGKEIIKKSELDPKGLGAKLLDIRAAFTEDGIKLFNSLQNQSEMTLEMFAAFSKVTGELIKSSGLPLAEALTKESTLIRGLSQETVLGLGAAAEQRIEGAIGTTEGESLGVTSVSSRQAFDAISLQKMDGSRVVAFFDGNLPFSAFAEDTIENKLKGIVSSGATTWGNVYQMLRNTESQLRKVDPTISLFNKTFDVADAENNSQSIIEAFSTLAQANLISNADSLPIDASSKTLLNGILAHTKAMGAARVMAGLWQQLKAEGKIDKGLADILKDSSMEVVDFLKPAQKQADADIRKAEEDGFIDNPKDVVADAEARLDAEQEELAKNPPEPEGTPQPIPAEESVTGEEIPAEKPEAVAPFDVETGQIMEMTPTVVDSKRGAGLLNNAVIKNPDGSVTGAIDPKSLKVSGIPQLKQTIKLSGDFNPLSEPILCVRKKDGSIEVFSGRARLQHAIDTNTPFVRVKVWDEKKSLNTDTLLRKDALDNIRQGTASAEQCAVYYFGNTSSASTLEANGYVMKDSAGNIKEASRVGMTIALHATDVEMKGIANGAVSAKAVMNKILESLPARVAAERGATSFSLRPANPVDLLDEQFRLMGSPLTIRMLNYGRKMANRIRSISGDMDTKQMAALLAQLQSMRDYVAKNLKGVKLPKDSLKLATLRAYINMYQKGEVTSISRLDDAQRVALAARIKEEVENLNPEDIELSEEETKKALREFASAYLKEVERAQAREVLKTDERWYKMSITGEILPSMRDEVAPIVAERVANAMALEAAIAPENVSLTNDEEKEIYSNIVKSIAAAKLREATKFAPLSPRTERLRKAAATGDSSMLSADDRREASLAYRFMKVNAEALDASKKYFGIYSNVSWRDELEAKRKELKAVNNEYRKQLHETKMERQKAVTALAAEQRKQIKKTHAERTKTEVEKANTLRKKVQKKYNAEERKIIAKFEQAEKTILRKEAEEKNRVLKAIDELIARNTAKDMREEMRKESVRVVALERIEKEEASVNIANKERAEQAEKNIRKWSKVLRTGSIEGVELTDDERAEIEYEKQAKFEESKAARKKFWEKLLEKRAKREALLTKRFTKEYAQEQMRSIKAETREAEAEMHGIKDSLNEILLTGRIPQHKDFHPDVAKRAQEALNEQTKKNSESLRRQINEAVRRLAADGIVSNALSIANGLVNTVENKLKDDLMAKINSQLKRVQPVMSGKRPVRARVSASVRSQVEEIIKLTNLSASEFNEENDRLIALIENKSALSDNELEKVEAAIHNLHTWGNIRNRSYEAMANAYTNLASLIKNGRQDWDIRLILEKEKRVKKLDKFFNKTDVELGDPRKRASVERDKKTLLNAIKQAGDMFKSSSQFFMSLSGYDALKDLATNTMNRIAIANAAILNAEHQRAKRMIVEYCNVYGIEPDNKNGTYSDKLIEKIANSKFNDFVERILKVEKTGIIRKYTEVDEATGRGFERTTDEYMSRSTLMNDLLMLEQPDYEENAKNHGFTEEVINKIKSYLTAEEIEFAHRLRKILQSDQLVQEYWNRTGVLIPENETYWPASLDIEGMSKDARENYIKQSINGGGWNMLKNRVDNNYDFKPRGVLSVFFRACAERNNYIYMEPVTSEWRELLRNNEFDSRLKGLIGTADYNTLIRWLNELDGAGMSEGFMTEDVSNWFSRALSGTARSYLSMSPTTLLRQVDGLIKGSLMEGVHAHDILKQILVDRTLGGHVTYAQVKNLPAFKARYGGQPAYAKMVKLGDNASWSSISKAMRLGMEALENVDVWANWISATALYNVTFNKLMKENEGAMPPRSVKSIERECEQVVTNMLELTAQPLRASQRSAAVAFSHNSIVGAMAFLGGEMINKFGYALARGQKVYRETGSYQKAFGAYIKPLVNMGVSGALIEVIIDFIRGNTPDADDDAKEWVHYALLATLKGASGIAYYEALPFIGDFVEYAFSAKKQPKDMSFAPFVGTAESVWKIVEMGLDEKDHTFTEYAEWAVRGTRNLYSSVYAIKDFNYGGRIGRGFTIASACLSAAVAAGNSVYPLIRGANKGAIWVNLLPDEYNDSATKLKKKSKKKRTGLYYVSDPLAEVLFD